MALFVYYELQYCLPLALAGLVLKDTFLLRLVMGKFESRTAAILAKEQMKPLLPYKCYSFLGITFYIVQ